MKIVGIGCCVIDYIYQGIDFAQKPISEYISEDNINGLVFGEATLIKHLESHFNKSIDTILREIVGDKKYKRSLGGVAIATLIGALQLLNDETFNIKFYVNLPINNDGKYMFQEIQRTLLKTDKISFKNGTSAITYILCGTTAKNEGSRTFIGEPHADKKIQLTMNQLDEEFYESDIAVFSCIQWEQGINKNFSTVLKKCKKNQCLTIVGTANDLLMRGKEKWILGDSNDVYQHIDIIIFNKDEALYYSGKQSLKEAIIYYKNNTNLEGFLITDGTNPVYVYGRGRICEFFDGFVKTAHIIDEEKIKKNLPLGDTIGCGDNFVGGIVASVAQQLNNSKSSIDLVKACILGNLSGGLTSTITGGIFKEKYHGEKKDLVKKYLGVYLKSLNE
ncbi:carbohydrate kinase family protein [bacterium]|nr:carbohydrate kinase family protein [bacterium]